jgi:23S rRNA pseudouridine1911/1915/1917 synthase
MSESLEVPATLAGERVDRAVALLTGWSRAEVQVLIEDGAIQVDGRTVIKSRRLEAGEVVDLLAEPAAVGRPEGQPIPLVVVSEDADVIVIDKPAGLTCIRGPVIRRHPGQRAPASVSRARRGRRPGVRASSTGSTQHERSPVVAAAGRMRRSSPRSLPERWTAYLALVWGVPKREADDGCRIGRSVRRPTHGGAEGRPRR